MCIGFLITPSSLQIPWIYHKFTQVHIFLTLHVSIFHENWWFILLLGDSRILGHNTIKLAKWDPGRCQNIRLLHPKNLVLSRKEMEKIMVGPPWFSHLIKKSATEEIEVMSQFSHTDLTLIWISLKLFGCSVELTWYFSYSSVSRKLIVCQL